MPGSPGSAPSSPAMRHAGEVQTCCAGCRPWQPRQPFPCRPPQSAPSTGAADLAGLHMGCLWRLCTAERAVSFQPIWCVLSQRRMLAQLVAGPPAPQVSTATGSVAGRLLHVGRPHKTDCLAPRRCCRVWARHCPRTLRQEVGPTAVSRLPWCRHRAIWGYTRGGWIPVAAHLAALACRCRVVVLCLPVPRPEEGAAACGSQERGICGWQRAGPALCGARPG